MSKNQKIEFNFLLCIVNFKRHTMFGFKLTKEVFLSYLGAMGFVTNTTYFIMGKICCIGAMGFVTNTTYLYHG